MFGSEGTTPFQGDEASGFERFAEARAGPALYSPDSHRLPVLVAASLALAIALGMQRARSTAAIYRAAGGEWILTHTSQDRSCKAGARQDQWLTGNVTSTDDLVGK